GRLGERPVEPFVARDDERCEELADKFEREARLGLGSGRPEHRDAPFLAQLLGRPQTRRLADPGRTLHPDRRSSPRFRELVERRLERRELPFAVEKPAGNRGHEISPVSASRGAGPARRLPRCELNPGSPNSGVTTGVTWGCGCTAGRFLCRAPGSDPERGPNRPERSGAKWFLLSAGWAGMCAATRSLT